MRTKKIFISYSVSDKDKVPPIVEKLQSSVERIVIIDPSTDLSLKKDFRRQIQQKIDESDEVVVVWSEASAVSSSVNYEAGMADALGKKIKVVKSDEGAPELPQNLQPFEVIDLKKKS